MATIDDGLSGTCMKTDNSHSRGSVVLLHAMPDSSCPEFMCVYLGQSVQSRLGNGVRADLRDSSVRGDYIGISKQVDTAEQTQAT